MYLFSFIPSSSILGVTNFFILNVIGNVVDAVLNMVTIFTKNDSPSSGPSQTYTVVATIRTILACLLPSVNLKHGLSNSQLHVNTECISIINRFMGTKLSKDESWTSTERTGVGSELIIFLCQMLCCWVILIVVESRPKVRRACHGCCSGEDAASKRSRDWDDSVSDASEVTLGE